MNKLKLMSLATAACALNGLMATSAHAQPALPTLAIHTGHAPQPLVSAGRMHIAYELYLTNLGSRDTTLLAVDVLDRAAARDAAPLLHLDGAALSAALRRVGTQAGDPQQPLLAAEHSAIVFVWLTLPDAALPLPRALTHHVVVEMPTKPTPTNTANANERVNIDGVEVAVHDVPVRLIGPPLEGDLWLAANGPNNDAGHRRAVFALSGAAHIAQRYAIDWVQLYEDGHTWHDDPTANASYRAYGARVLAVADGVVTRTHDGVAENIPDPIERAIPLTAETLGGNDILLDIGDARYAYYAHLQPGSLTVRPGDHVKRGQVLGLLGNSGNSSEPHLHFHIADRDEIVDAEGVPYAFESFRLQARAEQVEAAMLPDERSVSLDPAELARWKATPAKRTARMLPARDDLIIFANH